MIIYPIHNLHNNSIVKILSTGLKEVVDEKLRVNYHPDFDGHPGNIFTILREGRYSSGSGTYYVMEDGGKYLCSAGWNIYPEYPDVSLILSRMYAKRNVRGNFIIGKHILPICIGESIQHTSKLWMTYTTTSKTHGWFLRGRVGSGVPEIYKKFNFLGIMEVYSTTQYVYQWLPGN